MFCSDSPVLSQSSGALCSCVSLSPHTLDAQSWGLSPLPGGTGECLDAESLHISGFFLVRLPLLSHQDYISLGMCLPHLVMEHSGVLATGREMVKWELGWAWEIIQGLTRDYCSFLEGLYHYWHGPTESLFQCGTRVCFQGLLLIFTQLLSSCIKYLLLKEYRKRETFYLMFLCRTLFSMPCDLLRNRCRLVLRYQECFVAFGTTSKSCGHPPGLITCPRAAFDCKPSFLY